MNLLIYSPQTGPRLDYILDFVFNEVLGCNFSLTSDITIFQNSNQSKLNYSDTKIESILQIIPHPILFEDDLQEHITEVFEWKQQIAFFKTSDDEIPFDLFGASFCLISRYEEYLIDGRDEFQRFPHKESLAFKNDFLNIPLVDNWLQELKKILLSQNPDLVFDNRVFHFIPTYDIDIAYSYKQKGFIRNLGGALKDISQARFESLQDRMAVLMNSKKDPFDSFDFLDTLHQENKLAPIYFFLLGSGGPFDKNISVDDIEFKNLIRRIAKKYEIGIHPSYRSNDEKEELNIEVQRLNSIASIQTTRSRQHYIRFELPLSYQNLIEQGITEDYSMGYGSINGFRASTSNSFFWFDLSKNTKTALRVFPFCFMECNSFFEQEQGTAASAKEIEHYIKVVKKVKGTFISIWHNFSLGWDPLWQGWKELYLLQVEQSLK